MKRNIYTRELLEDTVKTSKTWAEVCRKLNVKPMTGAQSHLTRRAQDFGIDSSHFVGQAFNKGRKFENKDALVFCVKGSSIPSHRLKTRLIRDGYKKEECEKCKRTEWDGEKIPLELDHIDSDHFNNELSNLQILCPNCHSLETSRRIKKSKVKVKPVRARNRITVRLFNPSADELKKLIWEMSTTQVAKLFNVSDKAIEKRCKLLGIEKPPRGYWAKIKAGKMV